MDSNHQSQCLLCGRGDATEHEMRGNFLCRKYDCRLCGEYDLSEQLFEKLKNSSFEAWGIPAGQTHLISGFTRERTEHRKLDGSDSDTPVFRQDFDAIRDIIENAPKRIRQKADVLLDHLIRRSDFFGQTVSVVPRDDYTLGYAKNTEEFIALLGFLEEAGYTRSYGKDGYDYVVTAAGHEHAERRKASNTESSLVFVAMRFSAKMNKVWEDGIKPAIEKAGFDPRRVDLEEHNDDVIDRMLGMIRESRFVVADFTEHRNGVYFEAGFSRGLKIPVIWCCKEDDIGNAHFDTNHFNHLLWSDPAELAEKLENRILATIGRGPLALTT